MAAIKAESSCAFECIPPELMFKIMGEMTVRDLTALVLTSKRFFQFFKENQANVMTTVLLHQPELDPVLFVYTTSFKDFRPDAMLYPRVIKFDVCRADGRLIDLMRSPATVGFRDGRLVCPRKIVFDLHDVVNVWNLIKVVDWWVEEYPRLHWHQNPEDRRCLRPTEELRLRKAIARWWLYAECHHGVYPRGCHQPKMWQTDGRLNHVRLMSSIEIRELEDLWKTLASTVSRDICSSIQVDENGISERVSWEDGEWRSRDIVSTYMKLDPEQMKNLFERRAIMNRMSVVRYARETQCQFEYDQETLSTAMHTVLQERAMLKEKRISDIPASGIIDEESYTGEEAFFSMDAWPTGKPPLTKQELMAYPPQKDRMVPYGDDGANE